ncbi:ras guanine nucleotide exchange factor domain-containing protein [Dichotomocladium elegans]|nr:ras guanine nucleotide exchange factor domain-containing protein [Dichotomocladium elegans]
MATPKILCTVRALHSFQSPEQSSLSFQKGDTIDVLSQLESGWWDGWCNGARGWFPSNYVEMVSVHSTEVLPTAGGREGLKHQQNQLLETPATDVISEDIGDYLYDPTTGSVQYRPRKGAHDLILSEDGCENIIRLRNGSITDSDSDDDPHAFEDAREMQKPMFEDVASEEQDQLVSKWVERVTPQGRTYYCNLITQETTWDYNDIDPATGHLDLLTKTKCQPSQVDSVYATSAISSSNSSNSNEPLTWQKLSGDVAIAIHQLNLAVHQNLRDLFVEHTAVVVETIRATLYAAGLMDQVSHHNQDPILRGPHRALIAALSKLVLSAKLASKLPLPSTMNFSSNDTNYKLQKDAGDVLAAVRNFVTACQQHNVPVEQLRIRFVKELATDDTTTGGITPATSDATVTESPKDASAVKSKHRLNQDLVVNMQSHVNQLYGSTGAFSSAIAQIAEIQHEVILSGAIANRKANPLHDSQLRNMGIGHFKQISDQMSRFLTLIEEIELNDFEISNAPALERFKLEKQELYDAFGSLFGATQAMSNLSTAITEAITLVEDALSRLEDAIERLLDCVRETVGHRRMWQTRRGASDKDVSDIHSPEATDPAVNELDYDSDALEENATVGSSGSSNLLTPLKSPRRTPRQPRSVLCDATTSPRLRQSSVKPDPNTYSVNTHSTSSVTVVANESTWFLGHDLPSSEIVFSKDGNVKGGTLPALVERLTLHDTLDTSFIANFLLTYRSFASTEDFVTLLEGRYTMTAPEGLTPQEFDIWTNRKQKLIRLRQNSVFNVMKNWLENYYIDEDEAILDRLELFTNTVIRDASSFSADQLERLISKRRELDADDHLKKLVPNAMDGPPSILPKNLAVNGSITLLDMDPLELSRQLSILDFKLYSSIRPIECLNKAWSKDDSDIAVHVKQSIDYCNRLTAWVTGSILEHAEVKKRVIVIKYWAQVAERCRQLNNFNTCMAIFSAFDNSAVGRLRRTWEIVGNRTTQTLNSIRKLMGANRNFTEYREMIHSINPPCIPFLGIYLQDLTFIEDGNPDFLAKSDHLINFAKRQKTAEVIREIKQFQSAPYTLRIVQVMQDFIQTQLDSSLDVEQLYERSLEIEPKASAAAEAARLLEMIN